MNRVLLIAKRDYLQTVLTKAYLFGLVMLPLLMGGGFLFIALASRGNNTTDQHIAVIDRTGISAAAVIRACEDASPALCRALPIDSSRRRITFSKK
ncbi:MAG TPA: hypothetical protein VGL82_01760 [Bryobacteraceae bacterium]